MPPDHTGESFRFAITIPIYNDWEPVKMLLQRIDSVCARSGLSPAILLVNDGSTIPAPDDFLAWRPEALSRIDQLDLYRNLGHQRAICVGMVHLCGISPESAVLVMDGDGEDPAEAIPSLIKAYVDGGQRTAVFAARRRRMEGFTFKAFYQLYRVLHLMLVGADIRIGNFSLVPPDLAQRLIRSSDLWNHYAASLIKSRLPLATIPIDRGKRLRGQSRMNFVGLVLHGLSAMSVYSDTIAVRILLLGSAVVSVGALGLVAAAVALLTTDWKLPGWSTNLFALTLVLMFQVVIVCLLLTLGMLAARSGPSFIPIRDCPHFVMNVRRLPFEDA